MTEIPTLIHDTCAHCGAPVDAHQRYCVACGTSRRLPDDPAIRHATVLARRSTAAEQELVAQPSARRGADGRITALVLALLPAAAALGVLVGKHGSGSDKQLLAALRARPAAASASTATAAAASVTSDFTLGTGYVVQLRTLPAGSDVAAVTKAKRAARARGATGVGVIVPSDFKLTPSPHGADVLYSGQFRTRAAARKALAKLRRHFPKATVVQVGSPLGGHDKAARIAAEDAVIRKHPTAQQKTEGAKIVQQIQSKRGKSYVQQQQKLPDTIVVP